MQTATGSAYVYTGTIVSSGVRGDVTLSSAKSSGSRFDSLVPRFRMQRGCGVALFSFGCRLFASDWTWTGEIAAVPAGGFPFDVSIDTLSRSNTSANPDGFGAVNWFSGGVLTIGSGVTLRKYPIIASSALASGSITLTLSEDISPAPASGDPVQLNPTCDKRWETCGPNTATNPEGRFDNRTNFRGHPFLPVENPTFVKRTGTNNTSKK